MGIPTKRLSLSVSGLTLALLALPISAQTGTPEPAAAPEAAAAATQDEAIAEVVVTAQRREEKLQEVPLAVTAFSSEQIESRGISNISDLNALAPGLQISKTPSNTTISQISIRGITQINPAIYWDPAVGIYVDGVYIGKAQGSVFDVVDLTAVEVLRGPQGTLYGRNTLAGAINLRTKAPSGVFGGSTSLELGNYNSQVQKATVDLPKWGIASVSIGARSERRDGWVDTERTSSVGELNNRRNDAMRLAADFDISDTVQAAYRYDRSNVNQSNNFDQLYRIEPTGALDPLSPVGFIYDLLLPYASQDREDFADIDATTFEKSRIAGHALTLSWDLDDHNQIKSITGYRRLEWNDSIDIDGSPNDVVFTQRFTDYDQTSQDLQLVGSNGRWKYVGGLYYFGDEGETNNPQRFFFGGAQFDSQYATKTGAWAAYTQVDFKLSDPMTLSAGIRYTREKKELDRQFGVRASASDPFFYVIPIGTNAEDTFSATTPMASIAYKVNQNLNLYARYAEGFKSGGFNGEFSQAPSGAPDEDIPALIALNISETRTPFKPEKQQSFELGVKSTLLDGRALLNLAVFNNKLDDLQTSTFVGGAGSAAASVIRNAGNATVRGAELEAVLIPVKGTQLRASYAYLDAEYDEFIDAGVNQADNRAFVHAPENSFNLLVDSVLYRASFGLLRGVADYAYTDAIFTYPYQLSGPGQAGYDPSKQIARDSEVDAYGLLNLRLGFTDVSLGGNATGELALFVRNALDEDQASNFIDFGPGFGSLTVANFIEPRTYGIAGIVRW